MRKVENKEAWQHHDSEITFHNNPPLTCSQQFGVNFETELLEREKMKHGELQVSPDRVNHLPELLLFVILLTVSS